MAGMTAVSIPYTQAPKATALFLDYVYQFERVRRFYGKPPFEISSYKEISAQLARWPGNRNTLGEILSRQNQALGCGEATLGNIRRLRDPQTFAVVTGQQVGLLSGPAFTLYKALTAVRLAEFLSAQGLPCVPVFWLATEDHDLDEVAQATLWNEAGDLISLSDAGASSEGHSSVGYIRLSAHIAEVLDQLEQILPAGDSRDRLMADLRECYIPGAGWGESFGRLMARLFSRFGVIMIDPLSQEVHEALRPCYQRALREACPLRRLLQERSAELTGAGYHAQVHVGDDSTLLFAAQDGNRSAVRQQSGDFHINGFDPDASEDLEARISTRPIDFSPSALFRPIVQDTLLPTVAYIAGPAELAYFGQAQAIYAQFGRPMPVIFPRAGFTLADHRLVRLLDKYDLKLQDVWEGEEHVRRRIAAAGMGENELREEGSSSGEVPQSNRSQWDGAQKAGTARAGAGGAAPEQVSVNGGAWSKRLGEFEGSVKRALAGLREDVKLMDPTLVEAIGHGEEKILYQIDRLKGKISRAALGRSELLRRHEQDLLRFLLPAGNLQEREISGIYFLARAGYELLDRLLPEIQTAGAGHVFFVY